MTKLLVLLVLLKSCPVLAVLIPSVILMLLRHSPSPESQITFPLLQNRWNSVPKTESFPGTQWEDALDWLYRSALPLAEVRHPLGGPQRSALAIHCPLRGLRKARAGAAS